MTSTTNLKRILAALLASSAVTVAAAGCSPAATQPEGGKVPTSEGGGDGTAQVGKAAPEFSADSVTGEGPTTLKDAKGTVVILDFWATFCGPCKKSFPKYQALVEQFGGQVNVIAVSVDEPEAVSKDQIVDFAKTTGVKFAVVWDKEQKAAKLYAPPPTMPTSFIIDKEGVIRHVHAGYKDGEEDEIATEVKALLGK